VVGSSTPPLSARAPRRFRPPCSTPGDVFDIDPRWRQFLRDWYKPLTEPVRTKAPLPRGAPPFHFLELPTVSYHLYGKETGDFARFTVRTYTPKNLAHVTISEIKTHTANVTITEIRKDRRYS
jgi:hypothetical protein